VETIPIYLRDPLSEQLALHDEFEPVAVYTVAKGAQRLRAMLRSRADGVGRRPNPRPRSRA